MTPFDDDTMHPKLPSWISMGVQPSGGSPAPQQGGGFIDALKKRLSTPQMKNGQKGAALGKAAVAGAGGGVAKTGGGGASL